MILIFVLYFYDGGILGCSEEGAAHDGEDEEVLVIFRNHSRYGIFLCTEAPMYAILVILLYKGFRVPC